MTHPLPLLVTGARRPAGPRHGPRVRTALLLAALLLPAAAMPAVAPTAQAQTRACDPPTGEEMPDNAGPYPLIDLLGLRHAWDLSTGSDVDVAVIDSGVDHRHPDLSGKVHEGSEFTVVPEEREYDRSAPAASEDCEGHGTAVAGLIAAHRAEGDRMTGVAPEARILPIRSVDGVENTTFHTLAAMIDDAVDSGADVINISIAIVADQDPIREAVERALAQDVVVVAASGNEGNQGVGEGRMYPAAYPGVIAVAAVDNLGEPLDSSNAGEWVDIAAYGEDLALVAPGGSGYRVDGGTSYAAAQVAGAAALVLSRFPDLPAAEVAARLTDSAAPVGGGRNDRTGSGIVDPFGALTHVEQEEGVPPADAGDATGGGPADSLAIQPVPVEPPFVSPTVATSLAWSGAMLLALLLGLLALPAVRRAVLRGWRAGPLPEGSDPTLPAASATRNEPTAATLRRLDGSDVPPPAPPGRTSGPRRASIAQTSYLSKKRT